MSSMLPEIKRELLAAAARRQRQRRPRRTGLGAFAVGATILTGASAIAAGTGIFSTGGGRSEDGGSYRVLAITTGSEVCLAVSGTPTGGRTGEAPTCTPRPLNGPLSQGMISYVDSRRLVAFVVRDDVATVTVAPGAGGVELKSVEGAPHRYFDVLIPGEGTVTVTARDVDGRVIATVDGASLGPIGRGGDSGE